MRNLLPLFLDLRGRDVLLVGGGRVAAAKLRQLLTAGAHVRVVSPLMRVEIERIAFFATSPGPADGRVAGDGSMQIVRRAFLPSDLDGVWLAVAAATPEVNRAVAEAANERYVLVNAVDDPDNATAYMGGVVRRDDVTIAISTGGDAPGLTSLLREALDAVLPTDLHDWMETARAQRIRWRRDGVPMAARKPLLLRALNALYRDVLHGDALHGDALQGAGGNDTRLEHDPQTPLRCDEPLRETSGARVPWLSSPEDSWL
jgi:uroporphyrin-III C-methyltransferase/precorrin-2 dehydrogenase/sirohydrochlorin ferrochelatase